MEAGIEPASCVTSKYSNQFKYVSGRALIVVDASAAFERPVRLSRRFFEEHKDENLD